MLLAILSVCLGVASSNDLEDLKATHSSQRAHARSLHSDGELSFLGLGRSHNPPDPFAVSDTTAASLLAASSACDIKRITKAAGSTTVDSLCFLSNFSFQHHCQLVSTGKPIVGCESVHQRAVAMRGFWAELDGGWGDSEGNLASSDLTRPANSSSPCVTPLDCRGRSEFVTVEVGVPGHGHMDVVRAALYARASAEKSCDGVSIQTVLRTNTRGRKDPSGEWHRWFLAQVFPKAQPKTFTWHGARDDHNYPAEVHPHECCPVCQGTKSPFAEFSKSAFDWFRCTLWKSAGAPLLQDVALMAVEPNLTIKPGALPSINNQTLASSLTTPSQAALQQLREERDLEKQLGGLLSDVHTLISENTALASETSRLREQRDSGRTGGKGGGGDGGEVKQVSRRTTNRESRRALLMDEEQRILKMNLPQRPISPTAVSAGRRQPPQRTYLSTTTIKKPPKPPKPPQKVVSRPALDLNQAQPGPQAVIPPRAIQANPNEAFVKVLFVSRGNSKRSFTDDAALVAMIKNEPSLLWANQRSLDGRNDVRNVVSNETIARWGLPPVVNIVNLEKLSPLKQCQAFASHHITFAMHGSSLGNILCSPPGGVIIEVFPDGFHLDMFGALATATNTYNINLIDGNPKTLMSRGHPSDVWTEAAGKARDVPSYQPPDSRVRGALKAAASILRFEAKNNWPSLRETLAACS